jgi:tetratricopeptide (TPR) repeat protein
MALASLDLVSTTLLRAQSDAISSIKDPAEYAAYLSAETQADPKTRAQGLEDFLKIYPQSVVKTVVLNMLVHNYLRLGQPDRALSAATRLLQVDPSNIVAIYLSVAAKTQQCKKVIDQKGFATDPAPCDDAAALAQKGSAAVKPTDSIYPIFVSAIALDDAVSKKDFQAAINEYHKELALFPPEATQRPGLGLSDTLLLADTYVKLAHPDMVNAVWFYARAVDFAPAGEKPQIEKKLDYWYSKYHGSLDGLNAVKTQAKATLFPPGTFTSAITPADTPAEKIDP